MNCEYLWRRKYFRKKILKNGLIWILFFCCMGRKVMWMMKTNMQTSTWWSQYYEVNLLCIWTNKHFYKNFFGCIITFQAEMTISSESYCLHRFWLLFQSVWMNIFTPQSFLSIVNGLYNVYVFVCFIFLCHLAFNCTRRSSHIELVAKSYKWWMDSNIRAINIQISFSNEKRKTMFYKYR